MGRAIAGPAFETKPAGRKVRTPWSPTRRSERKPGARGARGQRATRLVTPGGRNFCLGGLHVEPAPGALRASEAKVSATESATENKPPVQFASVTIWRKTFRRPARGSRKRAAEGDMLR